MKLVLAAAILILVGCVAAVKEPIHSHLAKEVEVIDSQFSKYVIFNGTSNEDAEFAHPNDYYIIYSLQSSVNKETNIESTPILQVYYGYTSNGESYDFNLASDSKANELVVIQREKKITGCHAGIGCNMQEHIFVELPKNYLLSKRGSDLQIKVSSRSGNSFIINLPAEQIGLQIDAVKKRFPNLI